ncbi:MAG: hypothetical protein LQ350_005570 [Teloschistes chrysophthalmus]|nr:MAG: hypothetical protein LQ350_005570 [Niorma chrysophthalma]
MPTTKKEPSEYVTLISNDGFEYVILREAACVAGTIKKMLDPNKKVCEYLYYNLKYRDFGTTTTADADANAESAAKGGGGGAGGSGGKGDNGGKGGGIPDMDIPPLLCMELLMAADFFDV